LVAAVQSFAFGAFEYLKLGSIGRSATDNKAVDVSRLE
jgi:hypothetical protein